MASIHLPSHSCSVVGRLVPRRSANRARTPTPMRRIAKNTMTGIAQSSAASRGVGRELATTAMVVAAICVRTDNHGPGRLSARQSLVKRGAIRWRS